MDYNQLTRPFDKGQIKVRQGRKNMSYQYVPSHIVIDRLNEIGTFNWNFLVKESKEINQEAVVLGSLQIGNTIKEAYGSASIDEKRTAGDSFKTAQALALTKAASLFGVPCIFHSNVSNPDTQKYQEPFNPNEHKPSMWEEPKEWCADCGQVLTEPEVQFSQKWSDTYQHKLLCKECQLPYRNVRRVK
ncbi:RAD52 family DNA repair protein [Cytobacillus sp. NCCP-133]|uniref:RAD52 family DNA repair protein n=1 Tax=Cytobacillus sp. NCCP-133 TaxID=766848 RepID=UPI00222E9AAB|nr:RAD52 family DNA repair protein [Cytobacillus sp. NCCP-133]GLB58687.1 hypothetical protein NCCP133_08200 [Cytobacillus sp. NCCP-133]